MSGASESDTVTPATTFDLLEAERERLTLPVLQEIERSGAQISCRTGCSACCYHFVVV
jgi:hypothetical protein